MAHNLGSPITNNVAMRIVMVGKTGIGKSATGNTILGRHCFESKLSARSMTVDCAKGSTGVDGPKVVVIDTPGLLDTRFGMDKTSQDITQCISYTSPGPHIFLVVIGLGRFTEEEKQAVQKIQEIFGQAADRYSMVLFTHGDQLECSGETIEEFLAGSEELQELVARCNGQYHVFNNMSKDRTQVKELLQKIRDIGQRNGGSHYTSEMFQQAERAIEDKKQRILREKEDKIRREREKMEMELQKKYQNDMVEMQRKFQAERERERIQREEERKKEREEMNGERRREMVERNEERRREREDRQREMQETMNKMEENYGRKLKEERESFNTRQEQKARQEAEDSNPLNHLVNAGEHVVGAVTSVGKGLFSAGKGIVSFFTPK